MMYICYLIIHLSHIHQIYKFCFSNGYILEVKGIKTNKSTSSRIGRVLLWIAWCNIINWTKICYKRSSRAWPIPQTWGIIQVSLTPYLQCPPHSSRKRWARTPRETGPCWRQSTGRFYRRHRRPQSPASSELLPWHLPKQTKHFFTHTPSTPILSGKDGRRTVLLRQFHSAL